MILSQTPIPTVFFCTTCVFKAEFLIDRLPVTNVHQYEHKLPMAFVYTDTYTFVYTLCMSVHTSNVYIHYTLICSMRT